MSTSTDGQINYGIPFNDGFEFPWDDEKYDNDIEKWWRAVNGYKPPFEIYTDAGNYAPGINEDDPRIDEYYEHRAEWDEATPLPVELVNYCSDDCPMHLLAIREVGLRASRGEPVLFDPLKLVVDESAAKALVAFCAKWKIKVKAKQMPGWYLTSYWG